jgi:hypothetical protein
MEPIVISKAFYDILEFFQSYQDEILKMYNEKHYYMYRTNNADKNKFLGQRKLALPVTRTVTNLDPK